MNDLQTSRLALATLVFALGAIGQDAVAANKFVRAGGPAGTGDSWASPYNSTATMVQTSGNTYWFAGGSYVPFTITANNVAFKRATATEPICTGAAGWNPSYDSQVIMNQTGQFGIYSEQDNLIIDGVVTNGWFIHGNSTLTGPQNASICMKGSNIQLRNLQLVGNARYDLWTGGIQFGFSAFGIRTNMHIYGCAIQEYSQGIFQGSPYDYITIERCTINNIYGTLGMHNNVFYTDGPRNVIWRYNNMYNWSAMGVSIGTLSRSVSNWKHYGNVAGPSQGDGVGIEISGRGSDSLSDIHIVNNTFSQLDHADVRVVYNGEVTAPLTLKNNISYDGDGGSGQWSIGTAPFSRDYNWFSFPDVYTVGEPHTITIGNTNFVPFVDLANRNYHIPSTVASNRPRNKGVALAAEYGTDPDGNARGADGFWDMGAYEYSAAPAPQNNLSMVSASYSVGEEDGTITVSAKRTNSSVGTTSVNYSTADGTAIDGVNYTSVSGTFSWGNGDSANKTRAITILDANTDGNPTFNFVLSSPVNGAIVEPSEALITIVGSGVPPGGCTLLAGPTWPATSATLLTPFALTGSYFSQAVQTTDPTQGGKASFCFTNAAGQYYIKVEHLTASSAADSFFVNINDEPTSPAMIWDAPTSTTVATNRVGWRGTGTFDQPEFPVKTFELAGGTNTIIIRGREADARVYRVTLEPVSVAAAVEVISVAANKVDGYYKAGASIPIIVTFGDTVDVTGTPVIALNSGGTASYSSGTGTTNLTFSYTVLAGQNHSRLDYSATNSLSGGTIKHAGVDANLALPVPSTQGSISFTQNIRVDTTKPTVSISAPTAPATEVMAVYYFIAVADNIGFTTQLLSGSTVTLNKTGTANGTLVYNNTIFPYTVGITGISGSGTMSITLSAGAVTDAAGNLSLGAGPSAAFSIVTTGGAGSTLKSQAILKSSAVIK